MISDSKTLIGWINYFKKNKFSKKFIDTFYFDWKKIEKKYFIKNKKIDDKQVEKDVLRGVPKEIIKTIR